MTLRAFLRISGIHLCKHMLWSHHDLKVLCQVMHQRFKVYIIFGIFIVFAVLVGVLLFFLKLALVIDAPHNIWNLVGGEVLVQQLHHPLRSIHAMFLNVKSLSSTKRKVQLHCLRFIFINGLLGDDFPFELRHDAVVLDIIFDYTGGISLVNHDSDIFFVVKLIFSES